MQLRTAELGAVVATVIVGVLVGAGGAAAAARAPRFTNTALLRPEGGTEPALAIAADGTMAVTALNISFPLEFSYTNLWKGQFGTTPLFQGPIDERIEGSYGGADADVDLGSTGTLHASTLVASFNATLSRDQLGISSIACPNANTSDHFAHCTSQLIDTTTADRPFITSDGPTVYVDYHDAGNSGAIRVQRSDDDGASWKRVGDATMGLGQVTSGATFNNDVGPIVADARTHAVYVLFSSGSASNKSKDFTHNKLYVASSSDLGQHWTANLVYQAPAGTSFGNPFPGGLALDPVTGAVHVAVSDGRTAYFFSSTDGARTWSPPSFLNVAPVRSALFPNVAAYGGTVDVSYYGTPASDHNDPNAVWNVYLAKSTDGGAHFAQTAVTATPNRVGPVCVEGSACFGGYRTLAEVQEVAIDPQSRRAAIAYATDTIGDPIRIVAGPNKGTYPSAEGAFTRSLLTLPGAVMTGATTYAGLACPGDTVPPPADDGDPTTPEIALIMRGSCLFADKAQAALDAGYDGFIVFNYASGAHGGDEVFPMEAGVYRDIPAEMVGHSTGLKIAGVAGDADLRIGAPGAAISVGRLRVQAALAQETP